MAESRTFESPEAERRFYQMLARFESASQPINAGGVLSRATIGARRLVQRRWLALRLTASVRRHTR